MKNIDENIPTPKNYSEDKNGTTENASGWKPRATDMQNDNAARVLSSENKTSVANAVTRSEDTSVPPAAERDNVKEHAELSDAENAVSELGTKKVNSDELEKIIDEVKADKNLASFENALSSEDAEFEAEQKKTKKPFKLHKLYRVPYREKKFKKKILKKIFIPNDKTFVQSFFEKTTIEKKGKGKEYFVFTEKNINRQDMIRLNRIARDIKKQKGRIKFLPLIAAIVGVLLILLFAYLFRNRISRNIVVSASEGAFGAKCDIGFIDFNLFDTHFQIKEYAVANKDAPMKNLFEIKNIDIYFDLLELSRGKFVCKNIAIDGISWNTDRTYSGALRKKAKPKKDKNSILENNPITQMVNDELTMIKNGVSVSTGLQAVREQTDPKLILEREINAFQSPKIKDEILNFVPNFVETWQTEANNTYQNVQTMITEGKDFANIDFQAIDSPDEVYTVITKLQHLIQASRKNIENAKALGNKIENDAKRIETLTKNAESYITSDIAHIEKTAADIKDLKVKGVGGIVSDLFRIFYLEALGSYYPRLMSLIASANDMQKTPKKEKKPTLADKSKALERLQGRNFLFSDHSAPTLLFKNIQISANSPEKNFTIAGTVQNITNDADRLNKPISLALSSTQKQFREDFSGIVDLRHASPTLVEVNGDFSGLDLALDAQIQGLPKLTGAFTTGAEIAIGKNNDIKIVTHGAVHTAQLTLDAFEPEFVSRIYREVLSRIHTVDLTTSLFKSVDGKPKLNIETSVDEQIMASVQKQLKLEIARLREMVIAEGKKYLEGLRAEYLPQLTNGEEILDTVKLAFTDSKAFEKKLQAKLKEAEARIKALTQKAANQAINKASEKIDEAKKQVQDEVNKQVENATKDIRDKLKDSLKNPFGW